MRKGGNCLDSDDDSDDDFGLEINGNSAENDYLMQLKSDVTRRPLNDVLVCLAKLLICGPRGTGLVSPDFAKYSVSPSIGQT